ncbi:MAG: DUF1990 domain-containing protein [Acidimicrobiales bacterium]|jgi:uncharacterized protein (UPF0548 family)
MFRLGWMSDTALLALAEAKSASAPVYEPVGMTLTGEQPAGFRHDAYRLELPGGPEVFARARRGLETWQAHLGAGLRVHPAHPPQVGGTVVVAIPLGPLTAIAPCRIVGVIDEPRRYGFAYGTLPGHPESGEESFLVEAADDGAVLHIVAASRPSGVLARLGAPVGRRIQTATTRRYLDALARWTAADG